MEKILEFKVQLNGYVYFYDCITSPAAASPVIQSLRTMLLRSSYEAWNTFTLYDPPDDYSVAVELPRYCKLVAEEKFSA